MKPNISVVNIASAHPLNGKAFSSHYDYHSWLRMFHLIEEPPDLMRHLNRGFDVDFTSRPNGEEPSYCQLDALIFYLSLADGWTSTSNFSAEISGDSSEYPLLQEGKRVRMHPRAEVCQSIAVKAFEVLCAKVFVPGLELTTSAHAEEWWLRFLSRRIFPVLTHFFREEQPWKDHYVIRNLEMSKFSNRQPSRQALAFLIQMIRVIWGWKDQEVWSGYKGEERRRKEADLEYCRKTVAHGKLWSLPILAYANKLGHLYDKQLDPVHLERLEDMAMRQVVDDSDPDDEFSDIKFRKVSCLQESFALGNPAAVFLERLSARDALSGC